MPSDRLDIHMEFMFPSQANELPSTPPHFPSLSRDGEKVDVPGPAEPLSHELAREVVRLVQCPQCSYPLAEPVTLPCGKSLCKSCLPQTHLRTNISYLPLANRLRGFECPFADCKREHVLGDCGVDVTLNKTLAVVRAEFENGRHDAGIAGVSTHVVVKDKWQEAGVPSLKEAEFTSRLVQGGKLLATYTLAESGDLEYSSEASYNERADETAHQRDPDAVLLARVKEAARLEVDCQVCYALFCDPLTTPCGHTFCRTCLHRVLDHSPYCPVCRRPLSTPPSLYDQASPPNDALTRLITAFWADALELRRRALLAEGSLRNSGEFDIPVFVCTLSFPSMPTFLHVFEPRYRLMIRRALEGDRLFGMVAYRRPRNPDDANFVELGTTLRITNVEFYPDGRSLLETVGVSRFRILRHGFLDGYVVARIDRINDISMSDEEELEASETRGRHGTRTFMEERGGASGHAAPVLPGLRPSPTSHADLETLPTRDLMDFATSFVHRMQDQSVGWLTARMLAIYGECPDDPAVFPWWFASILPVRDMQKYRLLGTTSVRERLKICCGWVLEWEGSRWSLSDCMVS